MSEIIEISRKVEDIGRTFEQFKTANDAHLETGRSDRKELATKLNDAITKFESDMDGIKTALNRRAQDEKLGEVKEMTKSKHGRKAIRKGALSDWENGKRNFFRGTKGKNCADEMDTELFYDRKFGVKTQTLSESTDNSQAGYVGTGTPTLIDSYVDLLLQETSPMELMATVKTVGSASDGYHALINNNDAGATWGSEPNTPITVGNTGTPSTQRPFTNVNSYTRRDIKYWELFANEAVTLQAIEDVVFDLEGDLARALANKLGRARAAAFVNGAGDGSYTPTGFTTAAQTVITPATADSAAVVNGLNVVVGAGTGSTAQQILSNDIMQLVYSLRTGYESGASFAAHRAIIGQIRELKTTTGQYLWQPWENVGAWAPAFAAGQSGTLAGYPIYRFNDMAASTAVSATTPVLTFANFKEFYYIVNRVGLQMLRDPYSITGQVVFKARQRVGGGIFNGVAGVSLIVQQS